MRMDMVAQASAEGRAVPPAVSVRDDCWWSNWVPIGKRAIARVGIIQESGCSVGALQCQEAVPQQAEGRVVMKARPRASLEMVQSQFLLELLIPLFHLPARFPHTDRIGQRCGLWQIGQRVADRAVAAPFD